MHSKDNTQVTDPCFAVFPVQPFIAPGTTFPPDPHNPVKQDDVFTQSDTPQGEHQNLPPSDPWSNKDFSTPSGAYGAIGTNPPGNMASHHLAARHQPIGYFPNPVPHPPRPNLPTGSHTDAWSQPLGGGNMSHPAPFMSPGFPPMPPHHPQIKPFRSVPPSSSSSSAHTFHRAVGQKAGVNLDPQVGFSEESPIPTPPNSIPHKRWSVPSFMYVPPPPFSPAVIHSPESQSWAPGYVHLHPATTDTEHGKVVSGNFLSSNDPWSQCWPPGAGFTAHPSPATSMNCWHPPVSTSTPAYQQGASPGLNRDVAEAWSSVPPQDGSAELQQLMKSLDIAEHLPVLKVQSSYL